MKVEARGTQMRNLAEHFSQKMVWFFTLTRDQMACMGIRERRVVKVQEKESVLKECHEEEIGGGHGTKRAAK